MVNNPYRRYILGVLRNSNRLGDLFHAIEAESGREVMAQTFRAEHIDPARLQAHLPKLVAVRHNNLARIIEVSEFAGKPIVVYERLTGETLAERAASRTQRPVPQTLLPFYLYQVAQALATAEKFRVGHGVLDANSIFLLPKGQVLVAQIGLRGALESRPDFQPRYTAEDLRSLAQIIDGLLHYTGDNDDLERTLFRMSQMEAGLGYPDFASLVKDLEYMRANVRTTALRAGTGATEHLPGMEGGPLAAVGSGPTALASLYFPDSGQVLEIQRTGEHTVGRRHQAQALVPDLDLTNYNAYQNGLSKLHARINIEDESAELIDMHSGNGTFLNGRRLQPETPAPLAHGDLLMFGKLKAQFLRYGPDEDDAPENHFPG